MTPPRDVDRIEAQGAGAVTIGVDVGGTKIAAGVVDAEGRILDRRQVPSEADEQDAIVAAIIDVTRQCLDAVGSSAAVGIGAAALVDFEAGVVLWAPNLAYKDLHLRAIVEEHVRLPVVVDNDANVAALAEAVHGAGRGSLHQVTITVGTGIGSGLILDGRVYRGAFGLGGELGHMIIVPDGPRCPCGNHGCWEAVASGRAIGRLARQRIEGGAGADLLAAAGGDLNAVTGELVGEAAVAGSPFARDVLQEAGRFLGIGFANIVNIFDPELIVVGGGAAAGTGDLLLDPARDAMTAHVVGHAWRRPVPVVPAALGADAGIVGAAVLAREAVAS